MNKQEILVFLNENKLFFKQRFNVTRIGLFGSYAINSQTDKSDIDIIVSMPSNFDDYYDLKDYLESHLHTNVDLGLERNMRELIRKSIENQVIYV